MAIIDDDDARIIQKKIWKDIEFVVYSELDDRYFKNELQILSDDGWGENLDALCDWCFTNGIDCQALYLMGQYCGHLYSMYKIYGSPVNVEFAARGLPWLSEVGLTLTYLTMRQISIKLHAPPPTKPMTLNEKIKSLFNSDPNKYVIWTKQEWADYFGVSRQAVEKTEAWLMIRKLQKKLEDEKSEESRQKLKRGDVIIDPIIPWRTKKK